MAFPDHLLAKEDNLASLKRWKDQYQLWARAVVATLQGTWIRGGMESVSPELTCSQCSCVHHVSVHPLSFSWAGPSLLGTWVQRQAALVPTLQVLLYL